MLDNPWAEEYPVAAYSYIQDEYRAISRVLRRLRWSNRAWAAKMYLVVIGAILSLPLLLIPKFGASVYMWATDGKEECERRSRDTERLEASIERLEGEMARLEKRINANAS